MTEVERERKERLKLQKQFGVHLVNLRKAKGIKPAVLARNCYMESSNLARIEAGRTNPSLFVIKKLATGLNITLEELLKGLD